MKNPQKILSPDEIPARFVEAWNERDANKIAELFDDDADFINVVGIWWKTRDDIRKAHDYGLKVIFNHSNLKLTKTKVKYMGEDVAVVHARMRLRGQSSKGDENPQSRFNIFTFVTHQTDFGWSCCAAQNTDIVPGKETNMIVDGYLNAVDYRKKK